MVRETEKQTEESQIAGARIIAAAINNLANSIREHTQAMLSEEEGTPEPMFDLAGNPL